MSLDPRARLGRPAGRRFLFEWGALGCLGVAVILLSALGRWTAGIDHLVYDRFLALHAQPALADIVVVEIDNASIERLGHWPWPRSVHANLLTQLARAQPAAVIYDVLFTEAAADDAQLARAIALSPTYLPVLLSAADHDGARVVVKPVAPLAAAAAGLGHINLEVDGDGIVRSVALFEGDAHSRWPQLMVPVWRAIRSGAIEPTPAIAGLAGERDRTLEKLDEARFLIPFNRNAASYAHVSFASVVAGEVPPERLRGRLVLIGVTASGLYDRFATPVSGELGPLPGVYIHANLLDTLLTGRAIDPVAAAPLVLVSLVPLVALLAGFLVLSPRRSLLLTVGLGVLVTGGSAALLYGARLWMSPAPAVVGLIVVYPVWNWRRLEMTMAYLRQELQRLADEPHLLPETPPRRREFGGDVLEQHMALMAQAAQRVQDMKRFVWDSLDSVPEPILVSDVRGVVLIANHAATAHFARLGALAPQGRLMRDVLGGLAFVKTIDAGGEADTQRDAERDGRARSHWPAILDPTRLEFADLMAQGIEVRDLAERDHLLRYAVCTNEEGEVTGWIAGLVDVSALHAAERQREDALRLLSHDMRSPQASILALVEIERARVESDHVHELLERIARYSRRALTLADDFVQLARAESQAYVLEALDLSELTIDASDEVWPQAHAKQIQMETAAENDAACWICADRSLMTRALVNIMNNAVKYSPPETRIVCTVGLAQGLPARVQCTIRDQGYGIPLEQQSRLFQRFRRFHENEQPETGGAGLGMAFVKTVVMRHGGEVQVVSAPGKGTAFTVLLPALDETQLEQL
ncbi:CHASE2 domain-containing protein [Paraburkholderia sp. BCC1885]|uniref:CHASE2 domain-containing protein n=1 Tax=Paraburkholderia sp. BCC1885 TaxID=2562669 RepID=UPI0011834BC8|nr:CHASE2 domain-containing protein [Paraburkholderia sp. BCC1885]